MRLQELCKTCASLARFLLFYFILFIANGRTALRRTRRRIHQERAIIRPLDIVFGELRFYRDSSSIFSLFLSSATIRDR